MIISQHTLEAVLFLILFIGAILMATVDSFRLVPAFIINSPAFLTVFSFAGFTYVKKDKYVLMSLALFFNRI